MSTWQTRSVAPELAMRYADEGLWADQTLGQLLEEALLTNRRLDFRVWSNTRPYSGRVEDVHGAARRVAGGLLGLGVGPGDTVAFQLPNWEEAGAVFYGCSLLGAVLVPVVHFYGPKELGFIIKQSRAKALITADRLGHLDYMEGIEQLMPGLPDLEHVVVVPGDRAAQPLAPAWTLPFAELVSGRALGAAEPGDPMSPSVIAYTSGTTSDPKGVIHSHQSLSAELRQAAQMASKEDRPSLMGAPVGHAIGMLGGLLGPLHRSRPVHLADTWAPEMVLDAFIEGDLCFSGGATFFLTSLLDHPGCTPAHLDHIRTAGLGGSPVPAAVAERASALGISLIRSYGSTEHPSITGAGHDEPLEKRIYTDGHALAGVDLRLVGEDGKPLEPGSPGRIESRGPELFAGYTDAALTAAAFDSEGWYSTGDIGIVDEDGYLTITDRVADIIIRGGENISAGEVEEQLVRMDRVSEAAVVAAPDARMGEHACAFLRVQPGASVPSLDDVRTHLQASGLARPKWPEEVRVVEDFPRTPSTKVKKFVLRDLLRSEAIEGGPARKGAGQP